MTALNFQAKLHHLKNIPKYSVGLGAKVSTKELDTELDASKNALETYSHLVAIEKCLQVSKTVDTNVGGI